MSGFSFSRIGTAIAAAICLMGISTGANAAPITIDFEANPLGLVPSYTESGVTFTPLAPSGMLSVLDIGNGGRSIIGSGPPSSGIIRADISGGASEVSILIGDNNGDTDDMFLRAFDALDNQIAEDTFLLSGSGFSTLMVNIANIAYVHIGAISGTGTNTVVTDEFTFTPEAAQPPCGVPGAPACQIPEPAGLGSVALFGLGIVGLGIVRRRKLQA